MRTALVTTDAERAACFDVLKELRPALERAQFLDDLHRMAREGFALAALWEGEEVRAVAGFRPMEMFSTGRILYVDDLVTASAHRSNGYGQALLAFLKDHAAALGCKYVELDSGTNRKAAHRFYEREGLEPVALHFSVPLSGTAKWKEPL
jgi:GNAT superfamily N-acetyltransferase